MFSQNLFKFLRGSCKNLSPFNKYNFKNIDKRHFMIYKHTNFSQHNSNTINIKKGTYLIDDENNAERHSPRNYQEFSMNCGEARLHHVGQQVILCGWLEYKRMNKFLTLRDGYGRTQLIIDEEKNDLENIIASLPYESVLQVVGLVMCRPKEAVNKNEPTGEIEVKVSDLVVLNKAKEKLPFNIRNFQKAKESLRMQYRYLDLRFPQMQMSLRERSKMFLALRNFLDKNGFVDIETPTLFKATPGGAQEFIVPTRFPGEFYSLVQSPQQFKQMLMAGSIGNYYQIARCYRDEGSRPDRQPEFTQLDIEMSFTNEKCIMALIEDMLVECWPMFLSPLPTPFPVMTYGEALENYGTDKPDLRYHYKLINCKPALEDNYIGQSMYALKFEEPLNVLTDSVKKIIHDFSVKYKLANVIQSSSLTSFEWTKKLRSHFGIDVLQNLFYFLELKEKDVVFIAWGDRMQTLSLLGKIRALYADILEMKGLNIKNDGMCPLWIVDFPLFELCSETKRLKSCHHPFTAPQISDLEFLESEPLQVKAQAYDLVLNGNEVGGGSMRIHNPTLQDAVFKLLDIDPSSMQHMLDMLRSGCPPHGGIALGLDRLMAVILKMDSIRDVIAFPKTFEGRDLVSGAPSTISEHEKSLYHIESVCKKNKI